MAAYVSLILFVLWCWLPLTDEALREPVIKGLRGVYEATDFITVGCQPQDALARLPAPEIVWLLDGREAS